MLYCLTVEYANLRENDLIFVALKVLNQTLFEAKQYSHFNALFLFFFKQLSSRKIMFNVQLK